MSNDGSGLFLTNLEAKTLTTSALSLFPLPLLLGYVPSSCVLVRLSFSNQMSSTRLVLCTHLLHHECIQFDKR